MTKRKRRRSWGSITTITKTKHVLRWTENTPEGRKRKSQTFYGTYREAILELDKKHVEHANDEPVPTVGKMYSMWYLPQLDQRLASGNISKNTYKSFTRAYDRDIAPTWANVPVSEVKAIKVQEWLLTLTYSVAQVDISVFKNILDFAVTYEIVSNNVLRRKYNMPEKATERSKEVYKLDDSLDMLSNARGQLWEAAFIVSAFGGARVGESLAITKDDLQILDIDGQVFVKVSINKQLDQKDNTIERKMKTEQSDRDTLVPLQYGGQRLLEIANHTETQWLNDDLSGFPISQGRLTQLWRKSAKDNYIPFRNLRNSWRTYAQYTWGVDYDTLELLMGHKLQGTTGAHYLRPTIEDLAKSFADALNRFEST